MAISHDDVEKFFQKYTLTFNRGLDGTLEIDNLRSLYSAEFIAAGPNGVMTGKNDDSFGPQVMKGYEHYRQIGTKEMAVTAIEVHPIDEDHCLAHVRWNSWYEKDGEQIEIPFTNTYLC